MFCCAYCCECGEGTAKDLEQALLWYRRAAERGYPEAMYHMGLCYENGVGTQRDQAQAAGWYRKDPCPGWYDRCNGWPYRWLPGGCYRYVRRCSGLLPVLQDR